LARRDVAGRPLFLQPPKIQAPEMARPGGLYATLSCARRKHLIRFFIENLSLFRDQLPSDHGASLINA